MAATPLLSQMRAEVLRQPRVLRVPIKRDKTKSGCLTLAFSGAHIRAEVLHNPCALRGPHQRGQEWPASKNVMMWIIICLQVVHKHVSCVMLVEKILQI